MTEPTVPVTQELGQQAIQRIVNALPSSWLVMPIGGIAVDPSIRQAGATTKDVDLVLVLTEGDRVHIPTAEQIVRALDRVLPGLEPRRDQTSILGFLRLEQGTVKVELIRGRRAGAGGYFVARTVLLKAASIGRRKGRIIRLPIEALAFLKAWAATDQDKLIKNDKDARGYHESRAAAFRRDVKNLHENLLDKERREPVGSILVGLLKIPGGVRRKAVEAVLRENGWSAALGGAGRTH